MHRVAQASNKIDPSYMACAQPCLFVCFFVSLFAVIYPENPYFTSHPGREGIPWEYIHPDRVATPDGHTKGTLLVALCQNVSTSSWPLFRLAGK